MVDSVINFIDNTLDGMSFVANILCDIEQYEQNNIGVSLTDRVVDLSLVAMSIGKKSR